MESAYEVRPHGANDRKGFIPFDTFDAACHGHRIFGGAIVQVSTGWDVTPKPMTIIETLTAQGFVRFMNGGNTHVYRKKFDKAELVVSGYDGDEPQEGWWLICAWDDLDIYESGSVALSWDDTAESTKEHGEPCNFAEALAAAVESVTTR